MDKLAKSETAERKTVFEEAATKRNVSPVIIEKDFWVCWILQEIFANLDTNYPIIFKGGTSLSKVYNAIERFSEDIDLAFSRESFGFDDKEFLVAGSNEKRRRREALEHSCIEYIRDEYKTKLETICATVLDDGTWTIEIDRAAPQTLIFNYPASLPPESYGTISYIKPSVRLELGTRSDHEPQISTDIVSYTAELFPSYFDNPSATVVALDGRRTFWEKLTILHAEFHRPDTSQPRPRLSRHYYDSVMLHRQKIGREAIIDIDLLEKVTRHKINFFPSGWANYEQAAPGTIKLVPHGNLIEWLRKDYSDMQEMIFGDAPSLDDLLQELREMEKIINASPI